jgi:DNA adenine methylase
MSEHLKLTPPLKWHGGKHYVAKAVLAVMPRHLHYVEPYFGAGQVLFRRDPTDRRLWWSGRTSDKRVVDGVSETINDLNGDLMGFYTVLKNPKTFKRLRHLLELTLFSESEWQAARQLLPGPGGDPVQRAAALFTLFRQSLGARGDTFAPTVRTRLRGGRNDAVNGWWNAIEGLNAAHERLRDVRVFCHPALDVIRQEDAPGTLCYLDPPYVPSTRKAKKVYGPYEMSEADHQQLLDVLLTLESKVILSGYPSELYDTALAGWTRHTVDLPNNAAGGKAKGRETEVLWCNY